MTPADERAATLSQMVAEEVRALMARRRISGRQLAAKLGVSPSWVNYRLTGKQPIDVNDMVMIAQALGVGAYDLLPPPEAAAAAVVAPKRRYQARRDRGTPRDTRPAGYPAHPVTHRTTVPRAA